MRKKLILLVAWATVFSFLSAQGRYKAPIEMKIFEQTPLLFNPTDYPDGIVEKDGLIYLTNGRIVLKKIAVPKFKQHTEVEISTTVVSNGDRWDKSGSAFVIHKESAINMMDIAANRASYPQQDEELYEQLKGIVAGEGYLPTVELMRFMTPFGVGYYSDNDNEVSVNRRPVYVDGWAEDVQWEQNISDLLPLLEGEVYVGAFIDTWTEEGYKIDVTLTFTESNIKRDKKAKSKVLPLVNTIYYIGQGHPDIFSRKDLQIRFDIPRKAKNIRLKYITTGHGGHSGGDEFRPQRNTLLIDGKEVYSFVPWRTDCASFRRYNPTSGVWLRPRTVAYISRDGQRLEKEIEESLASSDLSRSNWCPGSQVLPEEIHLTNLTAGQHTLTISIPDSKSIEGDKLNHWLVSAYLVWEE